MDTLKIGLYGANGHQIHREALGNPEVEIVAVAEFDRAMGELPVADGGIKVYSTLEEMLSDSRIQIVSLCSPKRSTQAADAIRCMEAGKHVYAEKPCALKEEELDRIIQTSGRTGMQFHEMAETVFMQPYMEMKKLVEQGTIGEVVQVFAQKSYPFGDWRPQDEEVDGGLLCQAGIYNVRFMEHIAGVKVASIHALETKLGNPAPAGECRRAVSMMMRLENGGLGCGVANYLSPLPPVTPNWGYEILRIFGTQGFLESIDLGRIRRLVSNDRDMGAFPIDSPSKSYLSAYIANLKYQEAMPFPLEEELHPTRMVLRAKKAADAGEERAGFVKGGCLPAVSADA